MLKVAIQNNFVSPPVATKLCGHGHMFLGVVAFFCCCGIVVFFLLFDPHVSTNTSLQPYSTCFQWEKV
jgi:hypothetical protein